MTKSSERDAHALILEAIDVGYFKLADSLFESGLAKQFLKSSPLMTIQ